MARAKHHVQDFITYRSDHMPGIMKQPSSFPEGERLQTSPSPVLRKETTGPDNPFPYSSPTTSKNDRFGRSVRPSQTSPLDRKRKSPPSEPSRRDQPASKRLQASVSDHAADGNVDACVKPEAETRTEVDSRNPIEHWVLQDRWPKGYFDPDADMSQPPSRKRSDSDLSYTRSAALGNCPAAYTPGYENVLRQAGMFMQDVPSMISITTSCKELCDTLRAARYDPPAHSLFQGDGFQSLLVEVACKNEPRVERDLTPELIPSPAHLRLRGSQNLEHVAEEVKAVWTRCMVLAGPSPTPDVAIGLKPSAFTDLEVQKLHAYSSLEKPSAVREELYFPFLLCEVKCGEKALNIADRQNMHSASIAVNAIVQLYRSVSREKELDHKLLVFSISHDHVSVRVYGHFPVIHGDKTSFYRHKIRGFYLDDDGGANRWTTYNYVRKLYDVFMPQHLERLRSAVAQLPEPTSESAPSVPPTQPTTDLNRDSQDVSTSVPASGDGVFKKPKLTAMAFLQEQFDVLTQENSKLMDQLARMEEKIELARVEEKNEKLARMEEKNDQLARMAEEKNDQLARMAEKNEKLARMEEKNEKLMDLLSESIKARNGS